MTNPFQDQTNFMRACDQTTDQYNINQFIMYIKLIEEEVKELREAIDNNNETETLDALVDILVVTIGAINSIGADAEGAWKEVMQTNFAKINSETGKVLKRDTYYIYNTFCNSYEFCYQNTYPINYNYPYN